VEPTNLSEPWRREPPLLLSTNGNPVVSITDIHYSDQAMPAGI